MERNTGNNEIIFEIKERIGVVEEFPTGWRKELNLVSWNGNEPKYDLRDWDPEHERMSRGITLTESQMNKVVRLVSERNKEIGQQLAARNTEMER